jgi:hypothetical protein
MLHEVCLPVEIVVAASCIEYFITLYSVNIVPGASLSPIDACLIPLLCHHAETSGQAIAINGDS